MLKKFALLALCASLFAGSVPALNAQQRRARTTEDIEAARRATIVLRCTYWTHARSGEPVPPLFYRDGSDYLPFFITEMAFVKAYEYRGPLPFTLYRKATAEEIEQRKEQGAKKSELEYIPYAQIPIPEGMKDVGILIPGALGRAKPQVFNFDESFFPKGSVMVQNLTQTAFRMGFAPPKSKAETAQPQSAELQPGMFWITKPVKTKTPLNVRVAVPAKDEESGWKTVYSSSGIFLPTTRSVIFAIPSAKKADDGAPRVDFRQLSVVPKPPPPPKVDEDDKPDSKKKGGKKNAKQPRRV